jgi:hypothetical protein
LGCIVIAFPLVSEANCIIPVPVAVGRIVPSTIARLFVVAIDDVERSALVVSLNSDRNCDVVVVAFTVAVYQKFVGELYRNLIPVAAVAALYTIYARNTYVFPTTSGIWSTFTFWYVTLLVFACVAVVTSVVGNPFGTGSTYHVDDTPRVMTLQVFTGDVLDN